MTTRLHGIRAAFAPADDPYRGGDLATACRLGALLWIIATAVTWLLLPLSQPDEAIGDWGWAVAALVTSAGLVGVRRMRRGQVGWNELLATSYVAVAQVALFEWLAGGDGTPYPELYLLVALYAGALHPPRRLLGVIAAISAASAAPLVYATFSADRLGQTALRLLLLSAVALLASTLMRTVRAQRVGLRERGDQAEQLARVDDLTRLPNRRAFGEALDAEIARAERFGAPLSLVLADLDGFKGVNDGHGHPAGDACLRAAADALRATLRQYDACFRWGGDEFAILLPGTAVDEAEAACRRAREAVAAYPRPDGAPLGLTCAPAQLDAGMTSDDLVAAADAKLLERKRGPGLQLARSA